MADPRFSVLVRQRALLIDLLDSVGAATDAGVVSGALDPYGRNGGTLLGDSGGGLSGPVDSASAASWKVLVYDATARDIIAPLLQVSDLRAHGVTLHLSAAASRQAIPDVPAVYLLAPTSDNVSRVAADAGAGLYDGLHVYWTSSLPRELLESLADAVARAGVPATSIATMYDLYANFVSLEHDLFVLNLPLTPAAVNATAAAPGGAAANPSSSQTFAALHAVGVTDGVVEAVVSAIVDGLFCVCATLTAVPIIRAPLGGAAEMVATQLDARLREHLRARNGVLAPDVRGRGPGGGATGGPPSGSGAAVMVQPVLIILDRTVDLAVMLRHAWTYQALASDVLDVRLNRVRVAAPGDAGGLTSMSAGAPTRTYDLDVARDEFWATNAGAPFPAVADAVAAALTEYQAAVADISRTAGAVGGGGCGYGDVVSLDSVAAQLDSSASGGAGAGADKLAAALTRLPALRKRKALIDMHTTLATALLEVIHRRGIDTLYTMEDELLAVAGSSGGTAAAAAAEAVRVALQWVRMGGSPPADASPGAPAVAATDTDRLRLALIAALCAPDEQREGALKEAATALTASGVADTRAIAFVRANKRFTRSVSAAALVPGAVAAPGHRRTRTNDSTIGLSNADADVGARLLQGSASMASAASALAASTQLDKVVSSAVKLGVQGFHSVAANLNKRLTNGAEKACATSRIVDALMGGGGDSGCGGEAAVPSAAANALVNEYGYWDPRSFQGVRPAGRPRHQAAIVFIVGGGSYVEYHNVKEHAGRGGDGRRRVVYGATEMITGDAFLAQLQSLGGPLS